MNQRFIHDFPRLAKESGFTFNYRSKNITWAHIAQIDIEDIVMNRKFDQLEDCLDLLIHCDLDQVATQVLDRGLVNLLHLAQLSISYLRHCLLYLDRCVNILQQSNQPEEKLQTFQCELCGKSFLSANYLSSHIQRRHQETNKKPTTPATITRESHVQTETQPTRLLTSSCQTEGPRFCNTATQATCRQFDVASQTIDNSVPTRNISVQTETEKISLESRRKTLEPQKTLRTESSEDERPVSIVRKSSSTAVKPRNVEQEAAEPMTLKEQKEGRRTPKVLPRSRELISAVEPVESDSDVPEQPQLLIDLTQPLETPPSFNSMLSSTMYKELDDFVKTSSTNESNKFDQLPKEELLRAPPPTTTNFETKKTDLGRSTTTRVRKKIAFASWEEESNDETPAIAPRKSNRESPVATKKNQEPPAFVTQTTRQSPAAVPQITRQSPAVVTQTTRQSPAVVPKKQNEVVPKMAEGTMKTRSPVRAVHVMMPPKKTPATLGDKLLSRLARLGIQPASRGLPDEIFKRAMAALQRPASKKSSQLRQHVEGMVLQRMRRVPTSSPTIRQQPAPEQRSYLTTASDFDSDRGAGDGNRLVNPVVEIRLLQPTSIERPSSAMSSNSSINSYRKETPSPIFKQSTTKSREIPSAFLGSSSESRAVVREIPSAFLGSSSESRAVVREIPTPSITMRRSSSEGRPLAREIPSPSLTVRGSSNTPVVSIASRDQQPSSDSETSSTSPKPINTKQVMFAEHVEERGGDTSTSTSDWDVPMPN